MNIKEKTLFVGDLHATNANLDDTSIILDLVQKTLMEDKSINRIIFLGDIFHNHSVVKQEISHYLKRRLINMHSNVPNVKIYLMAGNHDGTSPHSVKENAVRLIFEGLEAFNIIVVDQIESGYVSGPFFMVPFIGDNEQFIKTCQANTDKILVCHQTVEGACYENRSLAPGGVKQELIPQHKIISGHIHLQQSVGKVYYPGTPRALTSAEYNEDKGIHVYDPEIDLWIRHSTNGLVKCFIRYDIEQGSEYIDYANEMKEWNTKDDVRMCIHGSEEFYRQTIEKYKYLSERVRFIPDIRSDINKKIDVESDGGNVHRSLHKYVHTIYNTDDKTKGKIWKKLQTLIPNLGNVNS